MKLDPTIKREIEKILNEVIYEEKTLPLINDTITRVKEVLGPGYIVGYIPTVAENHLKLAFGKKGENGEYTVWSVVVGGAEWTAAPPEPDVPDEDPTGENDNGDPPPVEPDDPGADTPPEDPDEGNEPPAPADSDQEPDDKV